MRATLGALVVLAAAPRSPLPARPARTVRIGPVASAGPSVSGTTAVGRRLTALTGTLGRRRRDPLRLPVVPLRRERRALQPDPGLDVGDLHAGRAGRREDDRAHRLRDGRDGHHERVREPRRPDRARHPAPRRDLPAGRDRGGGAGQGDAGHDGRVEPDAVEDHLRVAALQPRTAVSAGGSPTRPAAPTSSVPPTSATRSSRSLQATFGTTTQSAFSTATAPATAATVVGADPRLRAGVTGTAAERRQLTVSPGTWSGSGTISFAYQWYRCDTAGGRCSLIPGATSDTYMLVRRDTGRTIAVTLHATDATGTATAYASLVGPIAPVPSVLLATRAAGRRRRPEGGPEPRRLTRDLVAEADLVRLRVAALQPERPRSAPRSRARPPRRTASPRPTPGTRWRPSSPPPRRAAARAHAQRLGTSTCAEARRPSRPSAAPPPPTSALEVPMLSRAKPSPPVPKCGPDVSATRPRSRNASAGSSPRPSSRQSSHAR